MTTAGPKEDYTGMLGRQLFGPQQVRSQMAHSEVGVCCDSQNYQTITKEYISIIKDFCHSVVAVLLIYIRMYVHQGVQKFGQTRLKFAVGRDCMQKHFSKYEIEKKVYFKLYFCPW